MTDEAVFRQSIIDDEHLRLLRIGYFISAATTGFFSLFGLFYAAMGFVMAAASQGADTGPPSEAFAWVFAVVGIAITTFGLALAGAKLLVAKALRERGRRTLCYIVAAITCLSIPWGTVLGAMTLTTLGRPSVSQLFDEP